MTLLAPLATEPDKGAGQPACVYALKRPLDIGLALLAVPIAVPLLLILGLLIRLTSPGPALFRQVRIGRGGRPFVCLKLRTMYAGIVKVSFDSPGTVPSRMRWAPWIT